MPRNPKPVKEDKKSSKPGKSQHVNDNDVEFSTPATQAIKNFFACSRVQQVQYVKKQVRESELMKLEALKEDLKNVRHLLEEMDVSILPNGCHKLIERLTELQEQVQCQGEKVANMLVEPDNMTAVNKKTGKLYVTRPASILIWDEIQKSSNAVQPRMSGKKAMATHMAERYLILDRLCDLYESLASRPADSQEAVAPRALTTTLLAHQLHALAWLRWRETQNPRAGILADDIGLGKTITMLALILSDKEDNSDDEDEDDDDDYRHKNKRHKAVVVSQWTSVLRLVEQELNKVGVRSVTLSGAVAVPARPSLVQAINDPNSDVTVMLLSLCAGGVGLNLCGANHLLLLDPHWNPQLEEQAQDRIYRVGQTKAVNIYRFMCVDTVEQTIRNLQQAKLELAESVLTGGGAKNSDKTKLTIEDLKVLFNMD